MEIINAIVAFSPPSNFFRAKLACVVVAVVIAAEVEVVVDPAMTVNNVSQSMGEAEVGGGHTHDCCYGFRYC